MVYEGYDDSQDEIRAEGSAFVCDESYVEEVMAEQRRRRLCCILKEWREWRRECARLEGGGRR